MVRRFEGTFYFKKKGPFSKNKKGTPLFIAKSGGHVPPVPPVPTSMFENNQDDREVNRRFIVEYLKFGLSQSVSK